MVISKTTVHDLVASDKTYYVWDERLAGFGVRVTPGGCKTYVAKLLVDGRQSWIKIGRDTDLTATEARSIAQAARNAAAKGNDPAKEKQARREAVTMSALLDEFHTRHVSTLRKNTQIGYGEAEKVVRAALGKRLAPSITREDLDDIVYGCGEHHAMANKIIGFCKILFDRAIDWGRYPGPVNPARKAKRYRDQKRERFLTGEEIARLAQAIESHPEITPVVGLAIRFLLLTGLRIGEARDLLWKQVDVEAGKITFKRDDHKTGETSGAKTIPLNHGAIEILNSVPRIHENPYVFVGRRKGKGLGCYLARAWRTIRDSAGLNDGLEAGGEKIVTHSLRHTFATEQLAQGIELALVGKMVGHVSLASTSRYAHLVVDRARVASTLGSANILEKLGPLQPLPVSINGVKDAPADPTEDWSI